MSGFEYDRLPQPSNLGVWIGVGAMVLVVGLLTVVTANDPSSPSDLLSAFMGLFSSGGWYVMVVLVIGYFGLRGRSAQDERAALADSLADMLLMDIPMADALQLQRFEFSERWLIRHSFMGRAVARIATRVERGSSLGDAVADERVFSPYWLLLLRQSEAHGHVIQTLRNLAVMERDSSVYTPNLVIRPILALGLLASIATFLSQYILPTFAEVMERSEGDTGFLSIHGLQELEPLGWLGMVALLGMCFGPVRRTLGQGVETLPVIWSLTRLRCQTVVCSSLATMLSMGMPLDESLRAAALVARQPRYRNALTEAGRDPGESLARALDRYPALFSSPLRRLVLHGETFGNLPDMLAQASVWLSEEASQVQSRMRTLIQIGLTAATGLAVGYMCLTVMGGLMITVIDISSRGVLP